MKNRLAYTFIFLALVITAALSGCSSAEYKMLTNFTEYKVLQTQSVTQINAKIIMRGLEFEEFTLSDKQTVDSVMQALNSEKLIKTDKASDTDLSVISLYSDGILLAELGLNGIVHDNVYYGYSSETVKNIIYKSGWEQDRFRGFCGLDYALTEEINLDGINKIKVSLQKQGAENLTEYAITEAEKISAIMSELRDNRAYIFIYSEWEATDVSCITVYDNEGKSAEINLTQLKAANKGFFGEGYYKLINEKVKYLLESYEC